LKELDYKTYGFTEADLEKSFDFKEVHNDLAFFFSLK